MALEIKVHADVREERGSSAARRCRRAGALPAVLTKVGGGSQLLTLNAHDFERMLGRHASEHLMVTLSVGGVETLALLREIQRHGVTGRVIHADFGEISRDHKLHLKIPVQLVGEPDGVRNQGGVLEQLLREVEVACFPGDIVERFVADVSALTLGQALLVGDLKLGEQFSVLTHADAAVATVVAPRVEEAAEAAPAEEAAGEAAPAGADAAAADKKADAKKPDAKKADA
jgi:large subunit ribosomal protein L25